MKDTDQGEWSQALCTGCTVFPDRDRRMHKYKAEKYGPEVRMVVTKSIQRE